MLKYAVMAGLLATPCVPAMAQIEEDGPFTYAPLTGGGMGWRDNSVHRDGGQVTLEMFTYFAEPIDDEGTQWQFQTVTFDCAANTYTTVSGTYLDQSGTPTYPVSAEMIWPVDPGTPEYIIQQVNCGGARFTDGLKAPNRAGAMQALAAR